MYLNCDKDTLQSLVTNVLKGRLGINEPSITIGSNIIYEEGQNAEFCLKVSENHVACMSEGIPFSQHANVVGLGGGTLLRSI